MTLVVEENYVPGVPQTTVNGWAPRGADWHWSAGGTGRAGWEATIRHLVATRWTVNASYHGGFWSEHDAAHRACRTILQWIVPTTKAAHSVNPANCWKYHAEKPRALQDARFAEVRRILARDNDPNADSLAIAYAGMPGDLERDLACPVFRADVRNLAEQLVGHPTVIDRPHFAHGWIQPISRYEMDSVPIGGSDLLIAMLYAAADPAQEDDMPTPPLAYVPQLWTANDGGAELREQADLSAPVIGEIPAGTILLTLGEAMSGPAWRLALAGSPERLLYVRRSQITDLPPGSGRDAALYDGIAAVVNARAAGQPVPIGGIPADVVDQAKRLEFGRGRDEAIAAYTAAGTAAARQVMP